MAQIKCENCGRTIRDTDIRCLYCNAINVNRISSIDEHSVDSKYDTKRWDSSALNKHIKTERPIEHSTTYRTENNIVFEQERITVTRTSDNKRSIGKVFGVLAIICLCLVTFGIVAFVANEIAYDIRSSNKPDDGYYLQGDELYYFDSWAETNDSRGWTQYWWKYEYVADVTEGEWVIYVEGDDLDFLFDFSDDDCMWYGEVEEKLGLSAEYFNISDSKTYIDAGHHYVPTEGYYLCDDDILFYYSQPYIGNETDASGWYKFDSTKNDWVFVCTYRDKGIMDDLLYYYPDTFFIGDSDAAWRKTKYDCPPSFFATDYYIDNQIAYMQD